MENFNSQFSPDEQILEIVRRMSEQEAEKRRAQNKASETAVALLSVMEIQEKHCKAKNVAQGSIRAYATNKARDLEPPTCTVCVERLNIGKKGMFMPCGHIFHPGCLKPWLESNNTCPVCRYEIPKESD